MTQCTWKDCQAEGVRAQLDKNKAEWAYLCQAHHDELEAALDRLEPKGLLRAWARAGHGHKSREEFKKDVVAGMTAIGQFAQTLKKGSNS